MPNACMGRMPLNRARARRFGDLVGPFSIVRENRHLWTLRLAPDLSSTSTIMTRENRSTLVPRDERATDNYGSVVSVK
jgi:hypothetical protein